MTTEEMIKVMLAYERGEQIEYRIKDFMRDDEWCVQKEFPEWDWRTFDYRVKPKPTYRPYKNAYEFLQAQREHGMYLRPSTKAKYMTPITISGDTITLAFPLDSGNVYTCRYSYGDIFKDFTWQDDTPCGVKEE